MQPQRRYYIVYRTRNLVNGCYYIGAHETNNLADGYLGSGKRLKRAIRKYGAHNFRRSILARCRSRRAMYALERRLIAAVLGDPLCYNIAPGGAGGFNAQTAAARTYREPITRSPETRERIARSKAIQMRGAGNSQYGTAWLSHDERELTCRVPRPVDHRLILAGWRPGRVMRYRNVNVLELELELRDG